MLSKSIKEARRKKGLTLKELGEQIGVSHAALSLIENGKSQPTRRTLMALARVLDNDFGLDWLKEYLAAETKAGPTKKELAEEMSVTEFISLKVGGSSIRRAHPELDMLTKLLEKELEKLKQEGS